MSSTNIKEFTLSIAKAGERLTGELLQDRVTAVAMEATRGVVETTPVDTGRLKGNWQPSVAEPAEGEVERTDATAEGSAASSPAIPEMLTAMAGWKAGQTIWLHNGVPYATYQENGTERMAGRFMVARTVERLRRQWGS